MNLHNIEYGMALLNVLLYAVLLYFGIRRMRRIVSRKRELEAELKGLRARMARMVEENKTLRSENRRLLSEDESARRMPVCSDIRRRHFPGLKSTATANDYAHLLLTAAEVTGMAAEIDRQYNGFTKRLAAAYQGLRDRDITTCCLLLLNIRLKDVSALMGETYSSTNKRKHKLIRTFGTENIYEFIESFANNNIQNPEE